MTLRELALEAGYTKKEIDYHISMLVETDTIEFVKRLVVQAFEEGEDNADASHRGGELG